MPKISKKYLEFNQEIEKVIETIDAETGHFNVSDASLKNIKDMQANFIALFNEYVKPNRGSGDVKDIQDYYKIIRKALSEIQQGIKNDPTLNLTNAQKINLYIHIDALRRHKIAIPNVTPVINVLEVKHDFAIIEISVAGVGSNTEGFDRLKMPKDIHGISFDYEIVNQESPAPTEFSNHLYKTRTRFNIHFEDKDAGKDVYAKATYYGGSGNKPGESSDVFKFTVI